MVATSRLGKQMAQVISTLDRVSVQFALIGGLALASHKVIRATQDIDLLINVEDADNVQRELLALGYHCLYRSADAANYLREDERVDLIYASRPIARRLLTTAAGQQTPFGAMRIVSTEGLIGLKLQALVNDPRRTQDLEDIRALLRANKATLNMNEVREYFRLFDQEPLLDEIVSASG